MLWHECAALLLFPHCVIAAAVPASKQEQVILPSSLWVLAGFSWALGSGLGSHGFWVAGKDFFVACYDWRTSPFTDVGSDGAHLQRARQLVEQAYNNTNGTRVYLMAHSNGPIYALGLLSSMSASWRQKYIGADP